MISVKCPACGLVDWNVGNCKRCETSLVGLDADGGGDGGYFSAASEDAAQARSVRAARRVIAVCALVVLGLTAVGALYLAHKPAKRQWFWSFYRHDPTVAEIFAHNLEVSGGAERVAELRSFRAEGRLAYKGGEAEAVAAEAGGRVTFVMHAKSPDKIETEVRMGPPDEPDTPPEAERASLSDLPLLGPPTPQAPQVRVTLRQGFDGARGWEYIERTILTDGSTVPIKQYSSREVEGEALGKIKRFALTMSLVQLAEMYTSLKLTGREPVKWETGGELNFAGRELLDTSLRGHEAYVVSGVNGRDKPETLYFDTQTGLLLRADFEDEDEEGEAVEVMCALGDYKEVGGLKLPHRLHFKWGEESVTLTFEKYYPNDPVPDSTFEMPE